MRLSVSALVLALFACASSWAADPAPAPAPVPAPPAVTTPAPAAIPTPGTGAKSAQAPASAPALKSAPVDYPHFTLRNQLVVADISARQGSLTSFSLLDLHPIWQRDWQDARLTAAGLPPSDPSKALSVLDNFNPAGGKHNWLRGIGLPSGEGAPAWSKSAAPAAADNTLVLEYHEGVKSIDYRLTYTLLADSTTLSAELEIVNHGSADFGLQPSLIPLNGIHQDDASSDSSYMAMAIHSGGANGSLSALSLPKAGSNGVLDPGTASLDYLALKSRFFAAIFEPGNLRLGNSNPTNAANAAAAPTANAPADKVPTGEGGGPGTVAAPVAAGANPNQPKTYGTGFEMIDAYGKSLQCYVTAEYPALTLKPGSSLIFDWKLTITSMRKTDLARLSEIERKVEFTDGFYKFFKVLAKILTACLNGVYLVVRNYGLAVVALTFLLKLALHRTTFKQQESVMKMQKLSPELKLLQEQYKGDKQKLAQKQMEMWKKHGVNPLGGCLPAFIQAPIFIALFQAFSHSADMRGEGFLWIHDLTLPDQVFGLPILGSTITLNPLPLIYIAVTVWMSLTQKMPTGGDPQQEQMAKMMRWMPVVFGGVFYNMPAGLVLYFTVNAILTTIEIKMVKRKLGMA